MFCPNCGSKLPENVNFCPECGTKLMAAPQAQPVQVPPVQQVAPAQPEVPAEQPAPKKGLIIGLSAAAALLLGVVAAVALFFALSGPQEPAVTYKGMTFTYGMEVDFDALERKFPDLEYLGSYDNVVRLGGVNLITREDEETGKTILVGVIVVGESSAKMDGVRVGDSESSFRMVFRQADHPISPVDTVVDSLHYSYYIYEGEVYHPGPFGEILSEANRSGDNERIQALNTETLMFSATVRDGEVVSMAFGDILALKYAR